MGAEYRKWISSTRIHRWCYCHRGWILVNRWRQNEAFESRWLVSCTSPSWAQRKIWICRMCFLGSESLIHGNSINLLLDNLQLTIINSKASPTIKLDVGVGIWTFSKNQFEPQANPLTFRVLVDSAECKMYEITGQTVIYSFRPITRNITRLPFLLVSHWFIWVFDEPGFLLTPGLFTELWKDSNFCVLN